MAQATRPIPQGRRLAMVDLFIGAIGATAIPMGTLGMNDGSGNAIPFLDTTLEGGTGSLLGFSAADCAAGDTGRFLFQRGCPFLAPFAKSGDVPTVNDIGKTISMQDNQTCKKTLANNGLPVILLEISSQGYLVLLP